MPNSRLKSKRDREAIDRWPCAGSHANRCHVPDRAGAKAVGEKPRGAGFRGPGYQRRSCMVSLFSVARQLSSCGGIRVDGVWERAVV